MDCSIVLRTREKERGLAINQLFTKDLSAGKLKLHLH